MARVSEKNVRYRTKDEICGDLAFVLACEELHIGTRLCVVDQVFWVWSEWDGKHRGCKLWSAKAREVAEQVGKGPLRGILIHEHLVPKKLIREKLLALPSPSAVEIRILLDAWCIGVVVTKEEDKRLNDCGLGSSMPRDWDGKDVWARYTMAGIDVPREEEEAC